jgi:glyoxylate reductase
VTLLTVAMPNDVPIRVTRRLPDVVEAVLARDHGATLNHDDVPLSPEALREVLATHAVVLCTLTDRITADVLPTAPGGVRLLANFGAGTNHIDLVAARERGIMVSNTPGVLTEDTADLTMLLILAAARRAREGARELAEGRWTGWRPTHLLGTRVSGATLGIVGLGRIGQAVARRAAAGFGMSVQYHARRRAAPDVERACGATFVPALHSLLATSDIVTLHCPATPDTYHLIDAQALRAMQPHAFLINTARGDVVDERALCDALERGTIAGAGLDVFAHEPEVPPLLLEHPGVYALPHLGSATTASRIAMGECALRNITAFLRGDSLPDRVC